MTETRTASNGRTISPDEGGRWKDEDGNYGYCAHFTKDWRCYTCGAMCDCGDYTKSLGFPNVMSYEDSVVMLRLVDGVLNNLKG